MVGASWKNLQLEALEALRLRWVKATLKTSPPLFHKAVVDETSPPAANGQSNTPHFQPGVIEKQLH